MAGRFAVVGVMGFAVQLLAFWTLTSLAGWRWLPATVAAVELAVVHNFLWHEQWTWRGRTPPRRSERRAARLVRFNMATGLTSIVGNVALMGILVGVLRIPAVVATTIAVVAMGAANFVVSDRWVFTVRLKPDTTYEAAY